MANVVILMVIFSAVNSSYPAGLQFEGGVLYNYCVVSQDNRDFETINNWAGEIGIVNVVPKIGFKLRGSFVEYQPSDIDTTPVNENLITYQYYPLTLCTSFNLMPFFKVSFLRFSMETGIGVYFWKGLYNNEVVVLPAGKMDEKDFGFTGGLSLQIKPVQFIGIEITSRYHYIASANLEKYGYYDKDEKLWENGIGLKVVLW